VREIDPAPFRLRLERHPEAAAPGAAGLPAVLADLDRRVRPFGARFGSPWAARRARGLTGGFRWDREDSRSPLWYPQGIAASQDGGVLLVSWYSRATGAARLTCVDLESGGYRHLRLTTAAGEAVRSHAGGLAWREDLLYAADTKAGLRVFDLSQVTRSELAGDARYLLTERARYRPAGGGLRFSFASVDAAAGGLLVGEYTDKAAGARLVRWPFAPGGLLAHEAAAAAWVTAHANLQGALALPDRMLLAESRGPVRSGTLHTCRGEASERRRWTVGGEDLALAGDEVVSLGEHPDLPRPLGRRRTVFRARIGL